jgi:shikimate dehydrogenase
MDWQELAAPQKPFAEVIGDPIGHSKSPLIHNFWARSLELDVTYCAAQVSNKDLGHYIATRKDEPNWRGCNITLPHKVAVLAHVSDPGETSASIGAANTIFRDGTSAIACTNTDAAGFWSPIAGRDLAGRPATVIGAGGAARAILYALSRAEVGPVTLLNRTPAKGAALLAAFDLKGRALPLDATLPSNTLLVNASSLGMKGQPPLDLDLSPLPEDALVYDAVYAPLETNLLRAARARGLETVNGLEMLVAQAAVAFELFFGHTPPRDRDAELMEMLAA